MVRTQIQLPNELHEKASRLAREKEISFAEVVRRGLEHLLRIYPANRDSSDGWKLAPPADVGLRSDPFADSEWQVKINCHAGK